LAEYFVLCSTLTCDRNIILELRPFGLCPFFPERSWGLKKEGLDVLKSGFLNKCPTSLPKQTVNTQPDNSVGGLSFRIHKNIKK
jgi:hypothetical protein